MSAIENRAVDTSRTRVLFVLQNLNGGGAERQTLHIIRHLDRSRFEPSLFLFERVGAYLDDVPPDVSVSIGIAEGKWSKYRILDVFKGLKHAARNTDLLVGSLQLRPTYLAFAVGQMLSLPTIGWVQNAFEEVLGSSRPWHRLLSRLIYPRLSRVICNSHRSAQSLRNAVWLPHRKLTVIYNLVDAEMVKTRASEPCPPWAEKVFSKPTVIGVGRLMRQKAFDQLLRAHRLLLDAGVAHHLLIVGSGNLQRELEQLIDSLGVRESAFLPGYISNPFPLIARSSVFALSSQFEGMPNVINEAMVLGIPVVATDCVAGPSEMLQGGKSGVLVKPGCPEAMASALSQMLSDVHFRRRMSRRSLERADDFLSNKIMPSWEQLLGELQQYGHG